MNSEPETYIVLTVSFSTIADEYNHNTNFVIQQPQRIQGYIKAALSYGIQTEVLPLPAQDSAQVVLDEIWKVCPVYLF